MSSRAERKAQLRAERERRADAEQRATARRRLVALGGAICEWCVASAVVMTALATFACLRLAR